MGLIKAALGSFSTVLGDQWREYFYCPSIPDNVLVTKGVKQTTSRSSNTKGSSNIISNGSVIAVNEGQCMMIVDQGKIAEFSAEPGEFTWNSSTEPSIFYGKLGENLKGTWDTLVRRFTMGGDTGRDQRVYFFNIKLMEGNKFGTPNPVPFRVVDKNIGLDVDISIRCNGEYTYQMTNPMLFYKNVCGNIEEDYTRSRLDSQLRTEFITALQPAFARISELGIRYSALPAHSPEIAQAVSEVLSEKWDALRGISVRSVGMNPPVASPEDEQMIKDLQKTAVFRNANMAAAHLTDAQATAMKSAAANENGAMMGFMGLNMAQQAGGINANNLFQMGAQQQPQAPAAPQNGWTCKCGAVNTGKFCTECGASQGWQCSCGAVNAGKFCPHCGKPKPAGAPLYRCDKCGWEPADPMNPPKFCPNCGDKFDENDIK